MKVEVVSRTKEFIVLEVSAEGLPEKRISVHIDSIADGRTTLEEQIEKAKQDGEVRLKRLQVMNETLGEQSQHSDAVVATHRTGNILIPHKGD